MDGLEAEHLTFNIKHISIDVFTNSELHTVFSIDDKCLMIDEK